MTAPTDRTELEEAIRAMEPWWMTGLAPPLERGALTDADCKRIQLVCDAAAAWAETMPPTRDHVVICRNRLTGQVSLFSNLGEWLMTAEKAAERVVHWGEEHPHMSYCAAKAPT